ncbi:MAG: dTMP kinase [Fusobacteriia bacterium 4572_132]|nr:MAG: dTMP kinase [Fusobacteriia bacterium 4572_132]
MKKNGMFITFEGVEGSGKTTQIKLLKKKLESEGYKILLTREPGGTIISEKIREILLDPENNEMASLTELLLYYASRSQHLYEKIKIAKNKGEIVLCDRFSDSTLAYQGYGRGLDKEIIKQLTKIVEQGNSPDLTILIDIDPEIGLVRAKKVSENEEGDRLEQEKMGFHKKVWNGYREIAKENQKRVVIIDGNMSIEELGNKIKKEVKQRLEKG